MSCAALTICLEFWVGILLAKQVEWLEELWLFALRQKEVNDIKVAHDTLPLLLDRVCYRSPASSRGERAVVFDFLTLLVVFCGHDDAIPKAKKSIQKLLLCCPHEQRQ
jgi:hypothetical protein